MSEGRLDVELAEFLTRFGFRGKGELCVALVVTGHAREMGLPLDAQKLLTERGGQVLGLGKAAVQGILNRHGIQKVLAAEGGRTSRGSLGNMKAYVDFLNASHAKGAVDLDAIELFWISRVLAFFAAKPFKLDLDNSKGLRNTVRELIQQAQKRQAASPGMQCAGAMLQHLVGAKLDCVLGEGLIKHHSFSTADAPSGRCGDFLIGDVAIHVTTTPGEAVVLRCMENLNSGLRPVIVTLAKKLATADSLAEDGGIADRIDVFEIEQFVALNIYQLGKFTAPGRRVAVEHLVNRYNELIDEVETDPSLRIELG